MPVGYFYKWEDNNHGLEHKCGTCKTVLSNPRAKKTCLGVHEEVCTRYHKTLFFLGQSHHCDACHKTDELHDKRHREIIKLVQKIKIHDGLIEGASPLPTRRRKTRKPIFRHRDVLSDCSGKLVGAYSEQSGDSKHDQNFLLDCDEKLEEQTLEEWNDSSTLGEDEPGNGSPYRADLNATSGEKKAAKAERKRAKQQAKVEIITEKDLQKLDYALHPNQSLAAEQKLQDASQGLAGNQTIESNITFNTHTHRHSNLHTGVHDKKTRKANHAPRNKKESKELKAIVDSALQIMGLDPKDNHATKERRALDAKVREAMYEDILAVANERSETMERTAGYWRYANRRTYNAMVRMNEIWDWATGAKLPEIEEVEELCDIAENESDATLVDSIDRLHSDTESRLAQIESNDSEFDLSKQLGAGVPREASKATMQKPSVDDTGTPTHTGELRGGGQALPSEKTNGSLNFQPGPPPRATLRFVVPSPYSSDDHLYSTDVSLEGEGEKAFFEHSLNGGHLFAPSSMLASTDEANQPKNALPMKENTKVKNHKVDTLVMSTAAVRESLVAKDRNNRFKGLNIETAAPKEDVELADPGIARFVPAKAYPNPSPSTRANHDATDFPALPSATRLEPVKKETAPATTPKVKVFNIGITAVRLHEARSKPGGRKHGSKGFSFGVTPAESEGVDCFGESAWTRVVKGKRC